MDGHNDEQDPSQRADVPGDGAQELGGAEALTFLGRAYLIGKVVVIEEPGHDGRPPVSRRVRAETLMSEMCGPSASGFIGKIIGLAGVLGKEHPAVAGRIENLQQHIDSYTYLDDPETSQ